MIFKGTVFEGVDENAVIGARLPIVLGMFNYLRFAANTGEFAQDVRESLQKGVDDFLDNICATEEDYELLTSTLEGIDDRSDEIEELNDSFEEKE